jgi:hypothetical protein
LQKRESSDQKVIDLLQMRSSFNIETEEMIFCLAYLDYYTYTMLKMTNTKNPTVTPDFGYYKQLMQMDPSKGEAYRKQVTHE